MISTFDNCLFVHIPKVAGQSIESVFLERAGLTWEERDVFLLKPNKDSKKGPPRLAHLFASEYTQLGYLQTSEFNQLYKFAFVRNPWERLVSEYTYRNYQNSFKSFVKNQLTDASNDDYAKGFDGYRHVLPQYQFIYDQDDNLLVDFVGRFENLVEDFAHVSKTITGTSLTLPKRNITQQKTIFQKLFGKQSARKNYKSYYDEETKSIVDQYYQKDIELFGYEF